MGQGLGHAGPVAGVGVEAPPLLAGGEGLVRLPEVAQGAALQQPGLRHQERRALGRAALAAARAAAACWRLKSARAPAAVASARSIRGSSLVGAGSVRRAAVVASASSARPAEVCAAARRRP